MDEVLLYKATQSDWDMEPPEEREEFLISLGLGSSVARNLAKKKWDGLPRHVQQLILKGARRTESKEADMGKQVNEVLERLRHVIGEETLSTMTAPHATGLGPQKVRPQYEKPADEETGDSVIGGPEQEKGGDAAYYDPEKKVSDYPYANPGKNEGVSTPTPEKPDAGEPKGKSVVGKKPKEEKLSEGDGTRSMPSGKPPKVEEPDGDNVLPGPKKEPGGSDKLYKPEKKLRELGKIDETVDVAKIATDVCSVVHEKGSTGYRDCIKRVTKAMGSMSEQEAPETEPAPPAEPEAPPAEPEAPAEPEKPEWEIYAMSGDIHATIEKAVQAAKEHGGEMAHASIAVKFRGDEAVRDAVIEALKASGFEVRGTEMEK